MSDTFSRKIGEVAAFAEIGIETFNKGLPALKTIWPHEISEYISDQEDHLELLLSFASLAGISDEVAQKQHKTANKLRLMRDLYIQDDWGNPIELLEWLSFFEGAALGHWELIQGGTKGSGRVELGILSEQAITFHQVLFDRVRLGLSLAGESFSS